MQKLLASMVGLMLLSSVVIAAPPPHYSDTLPSQAPTGSVPRSNGYDWSLSTDAVAPQGITLLSQTLAQLTALVPATTGQILFCNNCASTPVCVSTGIGTGAFVAVSVSTGATIAYGTCK